MTDLPSSYLKFRELYPEIAKAYDALGDAVHTAGPLDERTRQIVKLSLAISAGLEGAAHSHTRRALQLNITPEEIRQVVLLAMPTLGFPATMRALSWVEDVLAEA
ncbi:MAG: alkylhydroperoxidase [Chloroflexi bacterium OLB15]|nr:MAG: alkylhydroperoxidase [Chloroflexi bacterium OLB15]